MEKRAALKLASLSLLFRCCEMRLNCVGLPLPVSYSPHSPELIIVLVVVLIVTALSKLREKRSGSTVMNKKMSVQ